MEFLEALPKIPRKIIFQKEFSEISSRNWYKNPFFKTWQNSFSFKTIFFFYQPRPVWKKRKIYFQTPCTFSGSWLQRNARELAPQMSVRETQRNEYEELPRAENWIGNKKIYKGNSRPLRRRSGIFGRLVSPQMRTPAPRRAAPGKKRGVFSGAKRREVFSGVFSGVAVSMGEVMDHGVSDVPRDQISTAWGSKAADVDLDPLHPLPSQIFRIM